MLPLPDKKIYFKKNISLRVEKITHLVKCLLFQERDLSLSPRTFSKKVKHYTLKSQNWRGRDRKTPRAQPSLLGKFQDQPEILVRERKGVSS